MLYKAIFIEEMLIVVDNNENGDFLSFPYKLMQLLETTSKYLFQSNERILCRFFSH